MMLTPHALPWWAAEKQGGKLRKKGLVKENDDEVLVLPSSKQTRLLLMVGRLVGRSVQVSGTFKFTVR